MRARSVVFALLAPAVVVVAATSGVSAQTQTTTPTRPVLYELGKDSVYLEGCFGPCLCPILIRDQMRGRFILTPLDFDGLYQNYAVKDVKWFAPSSTSPLVLTGSGTYRVGGEFAVMHQLTLDLSTNGGPVERFDSGLVQGGGNFPAIDIAISLHGFYCYDRGVEVRAWPAMRVDVSTDRIEWEPARRATCYDVVMGNLRPLRDGGGDFSGATLRCVADDLASTWLPFADDPPPGEAYWFLVRSTDGLTGDSYDSGAASQVGSRDPGIAASPNPCP